MPDRGARAYHPSSATEDPVPVPDCYAVCGGPGTLRLSDEGGVVRRVHEYSLDSRSRGYANWLLGMSGAAQQLGMYTIC